MTGKERFLKAIHKIEPDRVPIFAHITPAIADQLETKIGVKAIKVDAFISGRISYNEILTYLGNDAVGVGPARDPLFEMIYYDDGTFEDEWHFRYKKVGNYVEIIQRPLADVSSESGLKEFTIPDPDAPGRWESARDMIKRYGSDYALCGCVAMVMFEMSWNLIGFEKFLIDLYSEEKYLITLMDNLIEYSFKCCKKLIELGVDLLWTGDDVGTQKGMLLSPDLWRKLVKPRMKHLFQSLKNLRPDIKILYHSCGSIRPIIPDLIEIGLDILNPVQPLAKDMNLRELKNEYGGYLSFCGGIDVQEVLPMASPEEVEEHVKKQIKAAAKGGGYIVAPAHVIQPDTPLRNIEAFFEAAKQYGKYPTR